MSSLLQVTSHPQQTKSRRVAVSLEGLAAVAVELKMFAEAALLLGKAALLRDEGGLFRQLLEDRFYQKTLASLRRHPDCDRLDDALRKGARIDERTLDELIQRITSKDAASGT